MNAGELEDLALWATLWGPELLRAEGWEGDPYTYGPVELTGGEGAAMGYTQAREPSEDFAAFVTRAGLRTRNRVIGANEGQSELFKVTSEGAQRLAVQRYRLSNFTSLDRIVEVALPAAVGMALTGGLATALSPAVAAAGVPAGAVPGVARVAAGAGLQLVQTGRINPEAVGRSALMQALGPGAGAARGVTTMGEDWGILNANMGEFGGINYSMPFEGDASSLEPFPPSWGTAATEDRGYIPSPAPDDVYADSWGTASIEDRGYVPQLPIEPSGSVEPTTPAAPPPVATPQPPAPTSRDWSLDTLIQKTTGAALSAISVVRAWEARKLPVNTTARTADASGNITMARADGNIYTRTASGQVSATRAPVGLPQTTVEGFIIVNNGDGTFTRIDPSGARDVLRYGAMPSAAAGGVPVTMGGMNQSTLLYLAGAAALFLVLRK